MPDRHTGSAGGDRTQGWLGGSAGATTQPSHVDCRAGARAGLAGLGANGQAGARWGELGKGPRATDKPCRGRAGNHHRLAASRRGEGRARVLGASHTESGGARRIGYPQ
jgi:hypothetical protein